MTEPNEQNIIGILTNPQPLGRYEGRRIFKVQKPFLSEDPALLAYTKGYEIAGLVSPNPALLRILEKEPKGGGYKVFIAAEWSEDEPLSKPARMHWLNW